MFKKTAAALAVGAALLAPVATPSPADALDIVAAALPPYGIKQGSEFTGIHVEAVREMARRVGHDGAIQELPWARAFDTVKDGQDKMLAMLVRTPEREELFNWVVPVIPDRIVIYSYGDQPPVTKAELDSGAKSVAVIRATPMDTIATQNNWPKVTRVNTAEDIARLLAAGRIDAALNLETLAIFGMDQVRQDPAGLVEGDQLAAFEVYVAASKDLADADLADWRAAFDAMKADGTLTQILARFGLEHLSS